MHHAIGLMHQVSSLKMTGRQRASLPCRKTHLGAWMNGLMRTDYIQCRYTFLPLLQSILHSFLHSLSTLRPSHSSPVIEATLAFFPPSVTLKSID